MESICYLLFLFLLGYPVRFVVVVRKLWKDNGDDDTDYANSHWFMYIGIIFGVALEIWAVVSLCKFLTDPPESYALKEIGQWCLIFIRFILSVIIVRIGHRLDDCPSLWLKNY